MLLTPQQLAERWQVSEEHLADLRQDGNGPDYMRLGHRTIRYRLFDVENFEMFHLVELDRNADDYVARMRAELGA